jgi:hypothetical protein
MAIDYSAARQWQKHVRALAMVESGENETAIGDGGRAFGLLQIHPSRFQTEARRSGPFEITVNDTWTNAQIKACAAYFDRMLHAELELVVMAWNLGTEAVFGDGERAETYYKDWLGYFTSVLTR